MLPNIGTQELLILLVIALLVFGAKRLPEMGAAMGKGIREFKRNITEMKTNIDKPDEDKPIRQLDGQAAATGSGEPKKLSE